jgi:hypothetical protein
MVLLSEFGSLHVANLDKIRFVFLLERFELESVLETTKFWFLEKKHAILFKSRETSRSHEQRVV